MSVFSRILLLAACGSTAGLPAAHAFATLGHGRLVATTGARADYDSNIFVSNREVDDWLATLTGEVRYIREAGIVTLNAGVGATALAFAEHDELNSFDPHVDARLGYKPSDKTEANSTISYRRNSVGNETVNARTESDDFTLVGMFEHLTTEKLGFRLTGDYLQSNYLTAGFSDTQSYKLGANGVYVYSPKLRLLSGVTVGESWTDGAVATRRSVSGRDWHYTVGGEGEFAPKVIGAVTTGYAHRDFESAGFDNTGALYLQGRVSWTASEKTRWTMLANQDLSVTAADQSARILSIALQLDHQIWDKLAFEGSVGVDRANYAGMGGIGSRKDEGYVLRARLNYTLRDQASLDVSAGYRDNDSTLAVSDYDRLNFGVGVTVKF